MIHILSSYVTPSTCLSSAFKDLRRWLANNVKRGILKRKKLSATKGPNIATRNCQIKWTTVFSYYSRAKKLRLLETFTQTDLQQLEDELRLWSKHDVVSHSSKKFSTIVITKHLLRKDGPLRGNDARFFRNLHAGLLLFSPVPARSNQIFRKLPGRRTIIGHL
ncbi:hypothetical protein PsorP6_004767 [Peronosclerospora sorghi]|uniref:Uncharacterized protein n=1 Tax=Peronosclerospora sorghi TaxID=230839 RepID=A0ACC0VMW1_9STRA|nr:hypothetical protein PsorP6_004767 [Peronosclerospora sorghi]